MHWIMAPVLICFWLVSRPHRRQGCHNLETRKQSWQRSIQTTPSARCWETSAKCPERRLPPPRFIPSAYHETIGHATFPSCLPNRKLHNCADNGQAPACTLFRLESSPFQTKHRSGALFRFLMKCVFVSSTRRLLSYLKIGPVVSGELGKTDCFAAENLLHILSHGCSLAVAIEPLQIKESVRVPLQDARR